MYPQNWKIWLSRLGLSGAVSVRFTDVDGPQIIWDTQQLAHEILLPPHYRQYAEELRCDFLNPLARLHLGKTRDSLFSVIRFTPEMASKPPQLLHIVAAAQQVVEMWAGDIAVKIEPKAVTEDIRTLISAYQQFETSHINQMPMAIMIGYALMWAENGRWEIGAEKGIIATKAKLTKALGQPLMARAQTLADYYFGLSQIPSEKEAALSLLETATQRTASILELPVMPRLNRSHEFTCWEF